MKFKAVLFDLGSTLIEYENHDWPTLGKMGLVNAYPYMKKIFPELPELSQFGENFYRNLRYILDNERPGHIEIDIYNACNRIFKRMGLALKDGLVEEFVELYYKPVTEQITVIPGAVEILSKIKKSDITIGLVSNSIFPEKFHLEEMENFGLREYFDFVIFSSSVGTRKPGKDIFNMALRNARTEPSQAIYIGDKFDVDIYGAKNAGLVAVWKYHKGRENPENIEPDYSIVNLGELETIILQ